MQACGESPACCGAMARCRAEADGEPKLAVKRLLMAARFLCWPRRRSDRDEAAKAARAAKAAQRKSLITGGEADAGSESGVVAEAGTGVEAEGCGSEAGLELTRKRMLAHK